MDTIRFALNTDNETHPLEMIFVEGTQHQPFLFGTGTDQQLIHINDFFIATFPVTQALWRAVMGKDAANAHFKGNNWPAENVCWNDITQAGGFLEKINTGNILHEIRKQLPENTGLHFRLPSETEWEYAARGGKHWKDNFEHSGSNNIDAVAWYKYNSWDETHATGQKAANQLGIYDMNGNVWEWCMDYYTANTHQIPKDGSPFLDNGTERILRGGCYHNWAIHCTVSKRYNIIPEAADGCIGFRLVLSL